MSVTDPLLKDLKGHAGKLLATFSSEGRITDDCPSLQPFCEVLEKIFQQGLNESFHLRRPECWIWMENVASPHHKTSFAYSSSVSKAKNTARVESDRGRFRLLVRICLFKGVLHHPVEVLLENQGHWGTYQPNSILGDEILGQIFLSVLLQCGKLKFELNLSNALFLDETWMLPIFEKMEFVPCKQLGLCVGFNGGKGGIVVKVQKAGVAAEDDKVLVGDVVTEINGLEITSATRTKLSSIMRQASGQPIQLCILRARQADGRIFPPIQRLLLRLDLHLEDKKEKCKIKQKQNDVIGFPVEYLGAVPVGPQGDVAKVCTGITKIVAELQPKAKVQIEVLEMGVKVTDIETSEIICNHTFMEISSCGKYERLPEYFAYIAGDTASCNTSSEFHCYIFRSSNEEDIANILYSIGKWHLGLTHGHHPLDHGFDHYLGVPYSLDMGCTVPPGLDLPPKLSCRRDLNHGDNGPWQFKCSLAGSAGPYKGAWQQMNGGGSSAKRTVWEGGHRVPAFIHWPLLIKGPLVSGALLSSLDIVPTVATLAGATLPSHHTYDGLDISQALQKGHSISGHQFLLHPSNAHEKHWEEIGAIRVGQMKAVYHSGGVEGCSVSGPPFRVHNPPLVFDISVDPEERFPLRGTRRDVVADQAAEVLKDFEDSVQRDNTSLVDFSVDPAVRPCCSHFLANCFCPWDELLL